MIVLVAIYFCRLKTKEAAKVVSFIGLQTSGIKLWMSWNRQHRYSVNSVYILESGLGVGFRLRVKGLV